MAENDQVERVTEVVFYPIYFGMLTIHCPSCEESHHGVSVGMTTLEDEDEPMFEGLPNLIQMGVVGYPCGHIFCSPCLTDKVANILNAREEMDLRIGLFDHLIGCEEHGVDFPGQS